MRERKDLQESLEACKCFRIRRSEALREVLKIRGLHAGCKSFGIRRSGTGEGWRTLTGSWSSTVHGAVQKRKRQRRFAGARRRERKHKYTARSISLSTKKYKCLMVKSLGERRARLSSGSASESGQPVVEISFPVRLKQWRTSITNSIVACKLQMQEERSSSEG